MLNPSVLTFVREALAEDIGRGDLAAALMAPREAEAVIRAKEGGVLAGIVYADALLQDQHIAAVWECGDGAVLAAGEAIVRLTGDVRSLLSVERTLLDILQHASGIATNARRYADAVGDLPVRVLDTRKTRPLLRIFEKYAARTGGAVNHRMGLDDALMVKDTHWRHIGDLAAYIAAARRAIPMTAQIEVECETLPQVEEALAAGADIVMCDNMDLATMREAVAMRDARAPRVLLEASGNVSLETIRDIALTGVDAVSSGSIVHHAVWLDFSMKMV